MTEHSPGLKVKRVVAGILLIGDEVLCCQRPVSDPFPLKWEFPGGKIELGETPQQALARELAEELSIVAEIGPLIETVRHSYSAGVVIELSFFSVEHWSGELRNLIFNDTRWVKRSQLSSLDFLEADRGLVVELSNGKLL